jgi:hypothetical protein
MAHFVLSGGGADVRVTPGKHVEARFSWHLSRHPCIEETGPALLRELLVRANVRRVDGPLVASLPAGAVVDRTLHYVAVSDRAP